MDYFDSQKNVNRYIKMAEGYNGSLLIDKLENYLTSKSTVLELGSGPGTDLRLLSKKYRATGSDNSIHFRQYIKKNVPGVALLNLDAVSIETDKKFDCVYSNKVLQHLTIEQFERSLKRQSEIINNGGIILHSLWRGKGIEEYGGLFFQYYEPEDIESIVGQKFEIISLQLYTEMDKDDSFFLLAKHK